MLSFAEYLCLLNERTGVSIAPLPHYGGTGLSRHDGRVNRAPTARANVFGPAWRGTGLPGHNARVNRAPTALANVFGPAWRGHGTGL